MPMKKRISLHGNLGTLLKLCYFVVWIALPIIGFWMFMQPVDFWQKLGVSMTSILVGILGFIGAIISSDWVFKWQTNLE